ncbi:MAG: T9SS C-terminal target domain-containing protein [Bacteroidetes bacterium]|nr:MAG: T9SS C-terminal target domain-containing protein [Bacteroidota bacterium]MBL1144629.1 T9SS C-terminal target domain-containing protein [Bacteroidota bacterium]MCB0802357.1 T9SS type A sorting domain-containing protein [Flavobacteriales bacterium]NOG57424.1 T9SS type A sorting domain-containing protein [Bacteroidota bacterium]
MKFKKFTLLTLTAIVVAGGVFSLSTPEKAQYFPREMTYLAQSAQGYVEYMEMVKSNQITGEIMSEDVFNAIKQSERMPKYKASLGVNWTFKGPDNIGGRTRAFVIDRNNSNHLFAGAVSGGLFESFDAGQTWAHYDSDFKALNVTCMTQAKDGAFYIGTGELFAGGYGARRSGFIGSGLFKLTGNGNFETIVKPASRLSSNVDWAAFGHIVADPNNENIIYAAMNNGIRKIDMSTTPATVTDPIGIGNRGNDVDISPDGKVVLTYQGGEIYVSHNGVDFIKNKWNGVARSEVAISPSNSNIMYAVMTKSADNCLFGVFRSIDGGVKWSRISPKGSTTFDMFGNPGQSCQGWYDMAIAVYPDDPGKIVVGGITTYRWIQSSVDPAPANGSWNQIDILIEQQANGSKIPSYVHADKHNIVFDPSNSDIMYNLNDGGIYKSTNFTSDAPSYNAYNFNYRATQYYNIGVNPNGVVMGGTQDNGTHVIGLKFNNNLGGIEVLGGDGFDADMSTINPSVAFATSQNNRLRRIQGIGTTSGNSNFSSADITSNNPLLGAVCSSPAGCSNVFYTATKLWESFNHIKSRDSVDLQITEKTLPPMKAGRRLTYRSANSNTSRDLVLSDTIVKAFRNSPASTLALIDSNYTLVGNEYLVIPTDTLIFGDVLNSKKKVDITAANIGDSLKTVKVNFDELNINTSSKVATINHPNGTVEVIPYNYGVKRFYSNQYLDNIPEFNGPIYFQVDTVRHSGKLKTEITVIDIQIDFYYKLRMQDRVSSIYASANWPGAGAAYSQRNVVISRDLLRNKPDIRWYNIAGQNSTPDKILNDVLALEFSKDGNYLFLGTNAGELYRVSDLDLINSDLPESGTGPDWYKYQNNQMAGKCEMVGKFSGRAITDIAIDPNNSNNMVVTLGNYGNANFVYRTTSAITMPRNQSNSNFEIIQGVGLNQLPKAPVYTAVFDVTNPNKLLVGTEIGVFGTENVFENTTAYDTTVRIADTTIRTQDTVANPGSLTVTGHIIKPADSLVTQDTVIYFAADTQYVVLLATPDTTIIPGATFISNSKDVRWTNESSGMGRAPVFDLEQMAFSWEYANNSGKIYAGTHGRGIFETDKFVGLPNVEHNVYKEGFKSSLKFYPNPVRNNAKIEFNLASRGSVQVQIYDIRGKLVKDEKFGGLVEGKNQLDLRFDDYQNGTYIIRVINNGQVATNKFVLYK